MNEATAAIKVSVIVAVGRDNIACCLNSLVAQTFPQEDYEILLVVNHPLALEEYKNVRVITVASNNPSLKRNTGAREARGKILAFIDDDAWAREDWVENGYAFVKQYPGASGVGGPRILPDGASFRERATDIIANSRFFGNGHGNWREMSVRDKVPHGMINSCNYFIHRELFLEIGGYNESIGYGGEDTEFVYRAVCSGRCLFAYTWNMIVYHPARPFGWEHIKQRVRYRFQNGRMLWVSPRIYLSNWTFSVGLFGATAFLLLALLVPWVFPVGMVLYFLCAVFVSLKYARYDWRFAPLLPFAFLIHHTAYYLSILAGIFVGIFNRPVAHRMGE